MQCRNTVPVDLVHHIGSYNRNTLGTDISKINLFSRFLSFSAKHPLGTDELVRDLLVRLAYGGRISLIVGFTAALFAAAIGTTVGLVAGVLWRLD